MPLQEVRAPQLPSPVDPRVITIQRGGPPTANQMLEAARAQRRELSNQLETAEERRDDLRSELSETSLTDGAVRAGLEARIRDTDARIAELDRQIAEADARVATAAAVPGATIEPPRPPPPIRRGPPEEAWVLGGMLIVFGVFPLAIAYARRLWKRPVSISGEMPAELTDRLNRLEQAVDAVAVELERVGEGQRYVTKVFAESRGALGAGAAEPIEVRQRDALRQQRP